MSFVVVEIFEASSESDGLSQGLKCKMINIEAYSLNS
jgi:hypothetical protein